MRYKRMFINDYCYYFAIVTYNRNKILIDNIELLRKSFRFAQGKFHFKIDAIVVLPDHLHMLLSFDDVSDYPKIISTIKRYFTQHCSCAYYEKNLQSQSRTSQRYKPVWQKRFYEHAIKNQKDYNNTLAYMQNNPVKHAYVETSSQWKYLSFK